MRQSHSNSRIDGGAKITPATPSATPQTSHRYRKKKRENKTQYIFFTSFAYLCNVYIMRFDGDE